MAQNLTILGSTGSIGISALRFIREYSQRFTLYGISCNRNLDECARQVEEFLPAVVAIADSDIFNSDACKDMRGRFPDIEFLVGEEGVVELARRKVDSTLSAIVGAAGLKPSMAALESTGRMALANKETLVMAGPHFIKKAAQNNVSVVPVDSEHSALFFLLDGRKKEDLHRLILTASGGSLRDYPVYDLTDVSPAEALAHPTWDMGKKITIDSATLVNKGLEVMEAHHLFGTPYDSIDILIHPESIIHSMVEMRDGAFYAHMGLADMVFPIQSALTYPEMLDTAFGRLDFNSISHLSFRTYEKERYPALELCYAAGKAGGTVPAVLNAANEIAVTAFLEGEIRFTDIAVLIEKTMEKTAAVREPSMDDIFSADNEARQVAAGIIKEF